MAFPPLLKKRAPDKTPPRSPPVADPQSRTRARRRLIGAAVLVALGVVAFPIVFETQPRPIPVDVSLAIPPRDGSLPPNAADRQGRTTSGTIGEAAPAAAPAPVAASPTVVPDTTAPEALRSAAPAVAASAAPLTPPQAQVQKPVVAPVQPARPVEQAKPPTIVAKPADKPAERSPEKPTKPATEKVTEKAPAKPPEKAAEKPTTTTSAAQAVRFVVQVGAFADEASAKDARARVERLGLKTFTQEVDVQGSRRIRVRIGPFASQAEAERVVATLKAGKLPGAVLKL